MKRNSQKDLRVTTPLISWKVLLIIFVVLCLIILAQSHILTHYLSQPPALIGILANYIVCTGVVLAVCVGLFWRYVVAKPLRRISDGARRVAEGDFKIQIEPIHKGKHKNELDVLIDDFNKMTRELASTEILKSDFISNVSHEIKTPLSIIQSYSQALKDGCTSPQQQNEYIDTIISAGKSLNSMISNILKLNKLENQQIFPSSGTFQLGEQLRRCALGFMEQWQAKDIDFKIGVADVAVNCDETLLELVWNNLLSNAIKFTPAGGTISLTSKLIDDTVYVTLKDSGCGIDEATLSRIFEKFYQGDTSHACEGNGLGLALTKRALEIIGGEIFVESEVGKGTAFTVKLKV